MEGIIYSLQKYFWNIDIVFGTLENTSWGSYRLFSEGLLRTRGCVSKIWSLHMYNVLPRETFGHQTAKERCLQNVKNHWFKPFIQ